MEDRKFPLFILDRFVAMQESSHCCKIEDIFSLLDGRHQEMCLFISVASGNCLDKFQCNDNFRGDIL